MKILVIEDEQKHLLDATKVLPTENIEYLFVSCLKEAKKYFGKVDGIITDVYFPFDPDYVPEINEGPNGVIVAVVSQKLGIPCVICTSGYHHGKKYNWACSLLREIGFPEMIDSYEELLEGRKNTREDEADHKPWEKAWAILEEKMKKEK